MSGPDFYALGLSDEATFRTAITSFFADLTANAAVRCSSHTHSLIE